MKRILILKTGDTARDVSAAHGDYDRWFTDAIPRPGLEFEIRDVTRGAEPEPPELPARRADGVAGIIVTGSVSAAYRAEPWMPPLERFLSQAESWGRPVLCVCFGAQLLAHARGGKVILNPAGWEIGSALMHQTDAALRDPLMAGLPREFRALATHEDRIERLPAGCVLLAGNDNSPVQAFRATARVWGVQFHPEATAAIIDKLIRLRADNLTRDAAAHGLAAEGHVERLLGTLRQPGIDQGRRVLDNFVRICLGE